MTKGYIKVSRTVEGKFYGQVKLFNGKATDTLFESPEYLTEKMAHADAACWMEFHMTEEPKNETEFEIAANDHVYEGGYKLNARKVADMISRESMLDTFKVEIGPLSGNLASFEGFVVRVYTSAKIWREFDVIKPGVKR